MNLQQKWIETYGEPLCIKARLPSWSLIADICSRSAEVGFLPDFLAKQAKLHPVPWQPIPSNYRILALYRDGGEAFQKRLAPLINGLRSINT